MTTPKHLVLDDDVYLKLKHRKGRSKFPVKAIGNSILRSALCHPSLPEVIGKKLIKTGKITREEYEQTIAEAVTESKQSIHHFADIIRKSESQTYTSGSWEFKPRWRSADESFQVLEAWARDGKKRRLPLHLHEEWEYMIVLAGKVQVDTETGSQVLEPMGFLCIPPKQIHSYRPLTNNARMMVMASPTILENTPNCGKGKAPLRTETAQLSKIE